MKKFYSTVNTKDKIEAHIKYYEKKIIEKISNYFGDIRIVKNKKSSGNEIFKLFSEIITQTKTIQLKNYQLQLVWQVILASLKSFYTDEYSKNKHKILASYGLKKQIDELFFISSRRMGKSLTLSFIACALAMSVPSTTNRPNTIAVFSITLEAAQRFITECKRAIDCMPYSSEFALNVTNTKIKFTSSNGNERTIESFCSNGDVCFFFFAFFY